MGKPKHLIKGLRGDEVGHTNHFFIKGKVATLPKGKIRVLRNVAGGSYSFTRRPRPSPAASSVPRSIQVGRKKTCFKIQVPATSGYRKTTSRSLAASNRVIFRTYDGLAHRCGAGCFWSFRVLPSRARAG